MANQNGTPKFYKLVQESIDSDRGVRFCELRNAAPKYVAGSNNGTFVMINLIPIDIIICQDGKIISGFGKGHSPIFSKRSYFMNEYLDKLDQMGDRQLLKNRYIIQVDFEETT